MKGIIRSIYRLLLNGSILLLAIEGNAQLSQGGYPMTLVRQKSLQMVSTVISMPEIPVQLADIGNQELHDEKSLKFAHAFEVALTPENSGLWYHQDGYRIWQLEIESKGAFSINLVFERYHLPPGAKLFVFNEDRSVVLGAFTSLNNKPYKKLGIYPVPGQKIIVQYEEPDLPAFAGELEIGKVAHAYKDVSGLLNRWTRRTSGSCNVNVNCESESALDNEMRSVMRIFATDELGTGTLINNLKQDGKPYVISALHVFDNAAGAETAVYDFNYESAFCTNLEGYDIQTVSGSKTVALFDSLDMIMVELNEMPPASYRAYWAGWDARTVPPTKSWTIHHPNGDTKKISHDTGTCDSIRYSSSYIKYGSWKILNWETGTTEFGSSGAGLFLSNGKLVGILQGGQASCTNLTYDLFTRFDKLFQYKNEASKRLKTFLDPAGLNQLVCDGYDPYYEDSDNCLLVSNFLSDDVHQTLNLDTVPGGTPDWITGNNHLGITEIAERFTGYASCYLSGVAVGLAKKVAASQSSELVVRVYSGTDDPRFALMQYRFPLRNMVAGAMNYLDFQEPLFLEGNFFIGIVLPESSDSLVFYHSNSRPVVLENSLLFYKDNQWISSAELLNNPLANMALLIQPNICSVQYTVKNDTLNESTSIIKAYPIPASEVLKVEFNGLEARMKLTISDLLGRIMLEQSTNNSSYTIIHIAQLAGGMYLLKAEGSSGVCVQPILVADR